MSLLLVLIPLLGAVGAFFYRSHAVRNAALLIGFLNLALTVYMALTFNPAGGDDFVFRYAWVESAGIYFQTGIDGISLLLLLLANVLAPLIIYSSFHRAFDNESRYYGLVLLMIAALNGVFMARDGLLFYIFYEMALIPIYFICAIWGGQDRIRVTMKFFIYTFIGSLFMLLSLLYLYLHTRIPMPEAAGEGYRHSFLWADLLQATIEPGAAVWVSLGFFVAFAVKMPLFPFHTWQPDTYTTAPMGGAMLLSGTMLKMGIYGVLRFMIPLAPESLHDLMPWFIGLSVFGVLYAGMIAVKQSDFKRLIAYSSIAHVGLIAAGIFAWNKEGLQGGMIQMFSHGVNVVGLFFVCDLLERRLGTRSLSDMGGIAKSAPVLATLFMIITLGSVAVPLTNGFPGEFLLLNGIWKYHNWLGAVSGLTIILGAVYMLRAYGLSMFGPANEQTAAFADLNARETLILGATAAMVLVFGFFPQILLNLTDRSVTTLLGLVQL